MRGLKYVGLTRSMICAAGLLFGLGAMKPVQAQTPPGFVSAAFYGGAGDQRGFGIALDAGGITLSGDDTTNGQSLALEFALPLGPTPLWAAVWPGITSSQSEAFSGVALTAEGAYFAGNSYSQTTDNAGGKETKSVLVKFSLDGPTGADVGGADWIAKPLFFPYSGVESFLATTSTVESGTPYLYESGFGQQNGTNATAVLAKYDTSGANQWSQVLGNPGYNDFSYGFGVTALNGNLYVAGQSQAPSASAQSTLWKCDASGNPIWTQTYPPSSGTFAVALGVAAYGNALYVAGYLSPGPAGGRDAFILKYDESGNLLWSRTWGGSADDLAHGIAADGSQVYVVGETASFGAGGRDAFLLVLNAGTGAVLSSTFYGGAQDDIANGVAVSGSDLYVVGESRSFASSTGNQVGQDDLMLLHYTLNSSSLSSLQISPTSTIDCKPVQGKVTLTAPAGAGGAVVTLASSNTAIASAPASVTVPQGATTALFTINTSAVPAVRSVTVRATLNGATKIAKLTVKPIGVKSLGLSPDTVSSGASSTGVVILDGPAPSGGITLTVTSNNAAATVPASITIPAGSSVGTFNISTSAVGAITTATIAAKANGVAKSAPLTIYP